MTQLRGVTCHMGLHKVNCHPTQANTPRLNLNIGLLLDLPTSEEWEAELTSEDFSWGRLFNVTPA